MINKIFDALTLALHGSFLGAHVFVDEAAQGLHGGDFIVGLSSLKSTDIPGGFKKHSAVFSLAYYPTEKREDSFAVAERVLELLELIKLSSGILLRGYPEGTSFKDGILHMKWRFVYFTYEEEEASEKMETLERTDTL